MPKNFFTKSLVFPRLKTSSSISRIICLSALISAIFLLVMLLTAHIFIMEALIPSDFASDEGFGEYTFAAEIDEKQGSREGSEEKMPPEINDEDGRRTEVQRLSLREYGLNFLRIPRNAAGEIFTRERETLKRNAAFAGIWLGTLALDQRIRDFTQENIYRGDNWLSRFLYWVGSPDVVLPGFAVSMGTSLLLDDEYMQNSVMLSMQALLLTSGITETSRDIVGRVRPRSSPDDHLNIKGIGGGNSFFSGHASGSWAVATVIGGRYPRLKKGIYALAGAVALSRIYEDAHWATDVLLGSAVGHGMGRLTLKMNPEKKDMDVALLPRVSGEEVSISVSYFFP